MFGLSWRGFLLMVRVLTGYWNSALAAFPEFSFQPESHCRTEPEPEGFNLEMPFTGGGEVWHGGDLSLDLFPVLRRKNPVL